MGVPFVTVVTLRICDEERVISICGVLGTGWYVMHIASTSYLVQFLRPHCPTFRILLMFNIGSFVGCSDNDFLKCFCEGNLAIIEFFLCQKVLFIP